MGLQLKRQNDRSRLRNARVSSVRKLFMQANSCSYENPHSCRSVNLYRYIRLRPHIQRSLLLNHWARLH